MKQQKIIHSILFNAPILGIAFLSICFAISRQNNCVIWGLPLAKSGDFLAIKEFFQWQLLFLPPLLLSSEYLGVMKIMEVPIRVRVKNDFRLHILKTISCMMFSVIWGMLVSSVGLIVQTPTDLIVAFFITILGQMMWMCLYLWVYVVSESPLISFISVILSTGIIFYVGELAHLHPLCCPTSWSMAARVSPNADNGIPFMWTLLACFLTSCILIISAMIIQRQKEKKL